jgi:DNA-binding PadR family transcriptional regulator
MFLDHDTFIAIESLIVPLSLETISKRHTRILDVLTNTEHRLQTTELIAYIDTKFLKKYPLGDIDSSLRDLIKNYYVEYEEEEGLRLYTVTDEGRKFLRIVEILSPEKCKQSSTPSRPHLLM